LTGAFGYRLSEFRNKPRSVWLVRASFDGRPANRVAQGKSGSWGALSFGYLFFVQAKKSNSLKKRKVTLQTTNQTNNAHPTARLQELPFHPNPASPQFNLHT
jgi:hypothetical protein